MKGLRDRAILAVLIGCGLRRSEVAALTFTQIQQRDDSWFIVDLVGKHGRVRTVPMPTWVKIAIESWTGAAGLTNGRVFRPVKRGGRVQGESMTEKIVWQMLSSTQKRPESLASLPMTCVAPAPSCAGLPAGSNYSNLQHHMKRPDQHVIDALADALFQEVFAEWSVNGSRRDYGWDYLVDVFRNGMSTGVQFHGQLKGSRQTAYSADRTFISQELEMDPAAFLIQELQLPTTRRDSDSNWTLHSGKDEEVISQEPSP